MTRPLRVVNGHGFRPAPHVDEAPRDYGALVADINDRREAHDKRVKAWGRTIWITFIAAVATPIVVALVIYVAHRT